MNLGLPHCRQILYHLSQQRSPLYEHICIMIPINIADYISMYVHLDKDTYGKVYLNFKKQSIWI